MKWRGLCAWKWVLADGDFDDVIWNIPSDCLERCCKSRRSGGNLMPTCKTFYVKEHGALFFLKNTLVVFLRRHDSVSEFEAAQNKKWSEAVFNQVNN